MGYRSLRADCVIETIDKLTCRIAERFPQSGLRNVCAGLGETARRCAAEADRLSRPQTWIRVGVYSVWIVGAAAMVWVATGLHYGGFDWEATSLVQILEPAMNIAVLMGIGVITLGRLEERWKRARALDYLHELRSIAHVVDMHQLAKDPHRPQAGTKFALRQTPNSPKQELHGVRLERYLDYCSEMLSLTGKLAALVAQSCKDAEVAAAASDVENLTTGLSRKIWQKIMVLDRLREDDGQSVMRPGARQDLGRAHQEAS
ncbi:MAG: hypothetical protein AAFR21_00500 [Pseudomonadota bacterium]